nr:S-layer homology domain-containing protein [Oscillospiraceae bacterium]
VYQLAAGDAPLILGRGETWQEAGEDGGAVSGYWYDSVETDVTAFAETGRTTSYKVGESALSDFEPGKLIALTKTVNKTVDTIVYTPVSGTELTLKASFGTAKNTSMEFRITNVSTGAVQTVSAVTDGSAGASVNWTAPAVGQYRIEADLRSGGAYFCETPAVCWYDAAGSYSKTATEYSLVLLSGETELNGSAAYGGSITPKLRQRTITVDGTTETVGDWTDVTTIDDKTLVYTCVQGSGEESGAIAVLEKPDAGVYTFYAYAGAKGAASERIGSAVLTVTPSAVTVTPTWDSGVTPVSANDVTLSSSLDGMSDAALKKVLSVNCGYFDKQKAGRYTVTLGYRTDADAGDDVAAFRNNYAATLKSDSFVVKPDSGTVSYSCGENGSIAGRYSDQQYNLVSGSSQMKGTKLIFTAVPESGYSVEQWTVNNEGYAPDDTLPSGFALTNGGQTLTLESYDAKPLNVFVSFQSDTNTIIYGVSSGVDSGSVSATFGAGLPIASGAQVNDETDVTFTAVPAEGYVVDHWTVDDVKYTRADGSDYTAKTLTLDGVSEAHTVYVSFAASTKTYTVSVQTANESGEVDNALAAIAITDADTGESITTMPVPEKSNLCFTATPANADNNMVKEWQLSTDGVTFTTVKGSGGQSTLMLYNLGADTTVRAIVTTAMRYTLSFGVAGLPDGANATLAAFSGAAPLTSGEQQSGYMQVDFVLTLDDNLYVTGWENAAEDDSDSKKATIASLNENTTVTVTVAKKPVVSITSLTGGTLCVSGTQNGAAETELSSGDYVDVNTALTVTATPNDGYVVDNIQNAAVNEARANGEITKQLDAVNADVTVTGAFLAKPVVTIVEGLYGTVTANGTADEAEKTLVSGDYVDYGTDVSVTLSPDKGYELSDPDAAWTAVPDSDDYTYTIQGVLSDQTIAPTWSAIPTVDVTYAVTDKTPEDDTTGLDGTLTASVTRRNMVAYAVEADSDGSESVYRDSVVTFAAVPESGYKVAKWIVNETEQAAAPELTITADTQSPQSVRVQFEQIGEEVSYGFDPAGVSDMAELSAVFTPKGGTEQPFTSGSKPATSGSITFSVSALADGYEIEGWYVNGARQETDASDAFVLPVTTDVGAEVMVRVIRCSYAVSFAATNGTVTATLGGTALADGSEVTGDSEVIFTAVPAATTGYAFEGWSVNGTKRDEESETLSLTVTEPVTVAASYELDLVRYAVTYGVVDGGEGTLSAKAGSKALGDSPASVNAGSSLRFTATAAEGRQVKGWYSDAEGTATIPETAAEQTVYSIESLTAPLSVYVAFEPIPTYTVTVVATGMGSVTAQVNGVETALAEDTLTVSRHDSVHFTALPDENHYLTAWTLDGEDLGNDSLTLDLADVTADCSVGADFAASQFVTLRTDCGEHGALTTRAGYGEDLQVIDAADGVNVEKGKNVTLSATPDTGYMVKSWTVNGTEQSNLSNSLTMENLSENTTVALQYEPLKLWAVPGSGTGYTVTNVERSEPEYGDNTHVRDRGSVSFTVAPLEGYSLTKLEVTQPTERVTIVKNGDGSYTVTVEQVTENIVLDAEALQMQTERKELTEVPDVLQETYDSPESLKTALRAEVRKMNSRVLSEQITFFDIVLQYTTDGSTWLPVTKDNFPVDGVTVSIPYTDLGEGADKTCTYTVIHMFTVEMNGHTVGETEQLASTKTETELRFTVTSLSPFAIGWSKSGGAGGSTGGSAAKTETVTLSTVEHGTVAVSDATASEGDTVTLTVTPEADYTLKSLAVTDKTGTEITLNPHGDGVYSFTMPRGTVRVSAVFAPQPCPGDQSCPLSAFADLNSALWYHDGVHWALENGVMNGGDDGFFHPEDATSRAMLVTVLHRMAGKPASDEALAFSDVPENKWYTEAVRWAAENGVVHGYSTGAFAPDDRLSREQLATILFRYAQAQGV